MGLGIGSQTGREKEGLLGAVPLVMVNALTYEKGPSEGTILWILETCSWHCKDNLGPVASDCFPGLQID